MGVPQYIQKVRNMAARSGYTAALQVAMGEARSGIAHRATAAMRQISGVNVYTRDWDLLIVLDACRVDAMQSVSHPVIADRDVGSMPSVGGNSKAWLKKTFTPAYDAEIANTLMVTANPYARYFEKNRFHVSQSDFGGLELLYNHAKNPDTGLIHPDTVTDAAIHSLRNNEWDRAIVHYMQPHAPYRKDTKRREDPLDGTIWDRLFAGELTRGELHAYYMDNLRWVLDSVADLLANVDAPTTVLTADHGEAFGECGAWNHNYRSGIESVRMVPWVETRAEDNQTRQPEPSQDGVKARLSDLGYLDTV